MSRRRKTGLADDVMVVVSRLPWWAGVGLAAAAYVLLHQVASQPVVMETQPGRVGAMAVQTIWKTLSGIGQYLVPVLCLIGAGVSAWRRHQRRALVIDVAESRAADALDGISWQAFEMLVGEGFRLQGYKVVETGGGGADGGVDLVLIKGGEKFLVQCKQWRALKVGVEIVRELYGVMAARGATGGFVVTSGRFTDDAGKFASGRNVRLIDGPQLQALIRQAKAAYGRDARPLEHAMTAKSVTPYETAPPTPTCPVCSKMMVRRIAKQRANAGGAFWGCSGYPACRGSRQIK
jgi:restriction system protein